MLSQSNGSDPLLPILRPAKVAISVTLEPDSKPSRERALSLNAGRERKRNLLTKLNLWGLQDLLRTFT
jgi:hypothetical protein